MQLFYKKFLVIIRAQANRKIWINLVSKKMRCNLIISIRTKKKLMIIRNVFLKRSLEFQKERKLASKSVVSLLLRKLVQLKMDRIIKYL